MKPRSINRIFLTLVASLIVLFMIIGWSMAPSAMLEEDQRIELPCFDHRLERQVWPFIRFEENLLKFPTGRQSLSPVFSKLDSILFHGSGTLNIVHMGGSHVQAGAIGHRMRELFDDLAFGVGDQRGLVFPFRVANTNSTIYTSSNADGEWDGFRCAHNKHVNRWGMSGMMISTQDDSASLTTWAFRTDSSLYLSDYVRLYISADSNQFVPEWIGNGTLMSARFDSVGMYYEWHFDAPIDTLKWRFIKRDSLSSGISIAGVFFGHQHHAITYNEIGVNGASTRSYLRCDDMQQQLATIHPDLVFFGIGINDAHVPRSMFDKGEFIDRYDSLVARYRSANPDVRFIFLTNNDSYYRRRYANQNGKTVQEAMYELAEKHNAAVWDLFEIMGGFGSIRKWDDAGLAKSDRIHFTREGYFLQAELMYEAFMSAFGDYLAEKGNALGHSDNSLIESSHGVE